MKTCLVLVLACALVASGLNAPSPRPVEIGDTFDFVVLTWNVQNYILHLRTPKGIINFGPDDDWDKSKYNLNTSMINCIITLNVTSVEDSGSWQIFYTTENEENGHTNYNLYVVADQLEVKEIKTKKGEMVDVAIEAFDFLQTKSCHLVMNDGSEYEAPNLPIRSNLNVEWNEGRQAEVACGISIEADENVTGTWSLVSHDMRQSTIERKIQFTIIVEVPVSAVSENVQVTEGTDLYVRLAEPAGDQTCELRWPEGLNQPTYEPDAEQLAHCGFIIKNVAPEHSGEWYITYGSGVIYVAPIRISVSELTQTVDAELEWVDGEEVFTTMGPEDASYCRIVDPTGRQVFEQFSHCVLYLKKAEEQHEGIWTLTVGRPGKIVTEQQMVKVSLVRANHATVITNVEHQEYGLDLTCSLSAAEHPVRSCKFLSPNGKVLLAIPGIGEGRYSTYTNEVSLDNNMITTRYGIRITNTTSEDRGFWRCTIDTHERLYYGFLDVKTYGVDNSVVSAGPTLTPAQYVTRVAEGEATFKCSIPSAIKYCYFRSNRAVYNVIEDTVTDRYEYVGVGLEAGECGIRIKNLTVAEYGDWSCHVGVQGDRLLEQRAYFTVYIHKPYEARHVLINRDSSEVVLDFYNPTPLEYCRFIRRDGFGFTTDTEFGNSNYRTYIFNNQSCGLIITRPHRTDTMPWVVVAKVEGHRHEISVATTPLINPWQQQPQSSGFWPRLLIISLFTTMLVLILLPLSNRKNRRWVAYKTKSVRNSFRFKKAVAQNGLTQPGLTQPQAIVENGTTIRP